MTHLEETPATPCPSPTEAVEAPEAVLDGIGYGQQTGLVRRVLSEQGLIAPVVRETKRTPSADDIQRGC